MSMESSIIGNFVNYELKCDMRVFRLIKMLFIHYLGSKLNEIKLWPQFF